MMTARWTTALLLLAVTAVQAWTPPAEPNPDQILNEAKADARAGRLDEAAAKHRWYHDKVLELMPSHSGVRLSFALSDWFELAQRHPPAMRDLLTARDAATRRLATGPADRAADDLLEVLRFNQRLTRWDLCRDAYAMLAQRHPALAPGLLHLALPALVETEDLGLTTRHLELELLLQNLERRHASLSDDARVAPEHRSKLRAYVQRHSDLDWSRLVWVLHREGRHAEAAAVAERGRKLLGKDVSTPAIEAALRGEKPPVSQRPEGQWFKVIDWLRHLIS